MCRLVAAGTFDLQSVLVLDHLHTMSFGKLCVIFVSSTKLPRPSASKAT